MVAILKEQKIHNHDDVAIDMRTCVIAHEHKIAKQLLYIECTFCIKTTCN